MSFQSLENFDTIIAGLKSQIAIAQNKINLIDIATDNVGSPIVAERKRQPRDDIKNAQAQINILEEQKQGFILDSRIKELESMSLINSLQSSNPTQNIVNTANEGTKTVTEFLQKNPVIVIGALLVVGVILIGGAK